MDDNATLNASGSEFDETFDFDALEEKLEGELAAQLSEMSFLEEEQEKIGSPEALGDTVMNAVWEQCINQIAAVAGEDFIKENGGLTLDLRDEAHIQTTENFEQGVIATHNKKIDYQARYEKWQDNFQKDEQGQVKVKPDPRTGKEQKVLTKDARGDFDKDRPKGSAAVHKDHTISAAEIIRDPEAAAHLSREEQVAFANSDKNLGDLDASANESKGDSAMSDWLDSERKGEKPAERFDIDEEELRERDRVAREEYKKGKEDGKQKSIEAGKQSQKEEFFRCGGKALRAAVMALLAGLVKEIIQKLIVWFRSAHKSVETLLEYFKNAIISFAKKLKSYLTNAASAVVTTVASMIFGPVVSVIRKTLTLLKQGWRSLKEAVHYIREPQNKGKPISILMLEVGKIVVTGLSAGGAIVLGEVIEKGLMTFPPFAVEIPMLGSLASLVGLFMGGLVSGVIGAIAIHLIDKAVAEKRKSENVIQQINKGNDVLATQAQVMGLRQEKLTEVKKRDVTTIRERHEAAASAINESLSTIFGEDTAGDHGDDFNRMDDALGDLLE